MPWSSLFLGPSSLALTLRDDGLALQATPHYRTGPNSTIELNQKDIRAEQKRLMANITKAARSRLAARDRRAFEAIDKRYSEMREMWRTLGKLGGVDTQLRSLARIHYRVYAQAGPRKLILVDGQYGRGSPLEELNKRALDTELDGDPLESDVDTTAAPPNSRPRRRVVPGSS